MGGATNNVRPEFLAVSLVNQSIIGPMYACPITSNLTYNFAGSPNGNAAMPAMTNVPYLYAFCFENGTKRSLVLINTDLTSSHNLSFGGINPPAGTVTQRQFAPGALDDMNEAATGTATNLTPSKVAIKTTTIAGPTSISLPPYSVTALDYTVLPAPTAATPTLSPGTGTYTSAPTVTISDTTPGASIYYTTDGTTPTTSATVYTVPITVTATETIEAVAVATGYSASSVASATYTLPMTFSISLSPASLALSAGQSAMTTVRIDSVNGFNQAVSFGCTGLPARLSCAFSSPSVTPTGAPATATLTVAANTTVAAHRGTLPLIPVSAAAFVFCLIGLHKSRLRVGLFVAALALSLTTLNACNGPITRTIVPVTSAITVTATAGAIQQTAVLTVTEK
jgi:hypothetical protein